ncbi:transglutaminase family protein [Lichenifustis flavocetrariae]|uniref:Transglutaminase family protein n=1 Tax=Lichenifustis flavocetrariae TaxID=2949735 RepID=A0AA41Z0K4_9HYPH|nr:transglutaminase family protein [Lichenifustis flavocetrariae]MCW6510573.1 transglutaminase family protein [Lichenifustis flavocetrariae]
MRLRLRHHLRVRFSEPTRNAISILRMTPRSHEGQRVTNWRIDVEPDCLLKSGEDHFGNLTHTLTVPGIVSELSITAQGELTCFDAAGVVRGTAERLPLDIYRRDTATTMPSEELRSFASDVAAASDNDLGKLHQLLGAVHQRIATSSEPTAVVTADAAFKACKGTSGDHAQIFATCARHLGFPARCAHGFYLDDDGQSTRHAWAEAYVDGLGWVGFDPVHDICPQDYHVRVAVGLDALDAAALRGTPGQNAAETVDVNWMFGLDQRRNAQAATISFS